MQLEGLRKVITGLCVIYVYNKKIHFLKFSLGKTVELGMGNKLW